jgi:EmrB/QacA subfamily drug resistance transporter
MGRQQDEQRLRGHVSATVPELASRERTTILAVCSLSLFLIGLDTTVVTIALPSIGRDFGVGVPALQWTVGAYTLVMASLLMLAGSAADRLGRKRVFVAGLTVFSLGSLLCAAAPSVELLVAFRVLQAAGGAMVNPVAMAIITTAFTDPRQRAQAVGVRGAVFGVSMALGPIVGGALSSTFGWRSIFWINLPPGLVAVLFAVRLVPETRASAARRIDPVGQLLVFVLLTTLTYAIIQAPAQGWSAPVILGALAAAGGALLGLLGYEPRRPQPLIDLRFFRSIPFASAIVTSIIAFAAFGGFLFLSTLYLQDARGLSPVQAGLAIVPMAGMVAVVSPVSGRIVGRRGPRVPLVVAGLCGATACLMLTAIGPDTSLAWLLGAYVVFGVGVGFVNAPITNTAVSGMPHDQAGVASALATSSRNVGQTLGVALVGALVTSHLGQAGRGNVASATHTSWWLLTACGLGVLLLGATATTRRAEASARRTAAQLNTQALSA